MFAANYQVIKLAYSLLEGMNAQAIYLRTLTKRFPLCPPKMISLHTRLPRYPTKLKSEKKISVGVQDVVFWPNMIGMNLNMIIVGSWISH